MAPEANATNKEPMTTPTPISITPTDDADHSQGSTRIQTPTPISISPTDEGDQSKETPANGESNKTVESSNPVPISISPTNDVDNLANKTKTETEAAQKIGETPKETSELKSEPTKKVCMGSVQSPSKVRHLNIYPCSKVWS